MSQFKYIPLLFLLLISTSVSAQIPSGYYNSASGLSGDNLKVALHDIIKDHKEFSYTSSSADNWDILKESDKDTANAANVMAGAVFFPIGSRIMSLAAVSFARNCSATIKRCSLLQIINGFKH